MATRNPAFTSWGKLVVLSTMIYRVWNTVHPNGSCLGFLPSTVSSPFHWQYIPLMYQVWSLLCTGLHVLPTTCWEMFRACLDHDLRPTSYLRANVEEPSIILSLRWMSPWWNNIERLWKPSICAPFLKVHLSKGHSSNEAILYSKMKLTTII